MAARNIQQKQCKNINHQRASGLMSSLKRGMCYHEEKQRSRTWRPTARWGFTEILAIVEQYVIQAERGSCHFEE